MASAWPHHRVCLRDGPLDTRLARFKESCLRQHLAVQLYHPAQMPPKVLGPKGDLRRLRKRLVHPRRTLGELLVGAHCQTWTILDSGQSPAMSHRNGFWHWYSNFWNRPYPPAQNHGTISMGIAVWRVTIKPQNRFILGACQFSPQKNVSLSTQLGACSHPTGRSTVPYRSMIDVRTPWARHSVPTGRLGPVGPRRPPSCPPAAPSA